MSYLLDALKKSKGEQSIPSDYNEVPQPSMYPSYAPEQQTNIYKWISIVLALILTLIVGIVLGNKYALLGVPESKPIQSQPAVSSQPDVTSQPALTSQPAPRQTVDQDISQKTTINTAVTNTQTTDSQINQAPTAQVETVAATTVNDPVNEQIPNSQATEQTQEQEEELQGEPQIVGYQPESINTDGKPTNINQNDISNDLLSKFNQAIKETEGTDESYVQSGIQNDEEIEGYLTRVPRITELKQSQQMQVPAMTYETHLYSSDRFERWVKINGRTMQETQWVTEDIQIYEIQRQFLILEMGHIRFSIPALTDWSGYGK